MTRLFIFIALVACAFTGSAQQMPQKPQRWEIGALAGSTGLGLEGAFNIDRHWRVRAGFEGMIPFKVNMDFSVTSYGGEDSPSAGHNFDKMADIMERVTGIRVDDKIRMECKPRMFNGKLLVDYKPWADKGWHVTAGFYWGTHKVGTATNAMAEMPALLAMNIYNRLHDYILETDFIDTPIYENGDNVIWLDPDQADMLKDKMRQMGNLGINVGELKDGSPYILQPNQEGMVKARAYVNSFKPYLGIGYDSQLKHSHFTLGFDIGMLFWGGTPNIYMHDGVNLSKDMEKIYGKPGDVIDVVKAFKVYPVANFRVAYKF